MIDRRLLNVNLTVLSVANEPAENPNVGDQYIVGSAPTGAFENATTNYIARYNGSTWNFFSPSINAIEVLNADTGDILRFNGSEWETVAATKGTIAPVLGVVPTGTTLPATASKGDKFLRTSDGKLYTATATDTWDEGTLTANGARYASTTDHKIYQSNGTRVKAQNLPVGELFLNIDDGFAYSYNGTDIVQVGTPDEVVTEFHTLTAAEVTAKRFTLENNIKSGTENNVLLSFSGLVQTVNVDFTASGNTISWDGKNLENIGLYAGDSFIVQYTVSSY